jgi:hypothetical protein
VKATQAQVWLVRNWIEAHEKDRPAGQIVTIKTSDGLFPALKAVLDDRAGVEQLLLDVLEHNPELNGDADLQRRIRTFVEGGSIIGNE